MTERVYLEIGNICNLKCSFCPSTKRAPRQMSLEEIRAVLEKLRGKCKYLYLHLMGEPLLHPELDGILSLADSVGQRVCITTNGTLLGRRGEILIQHRKSLHKVSVSLHAPEGNSLNSDSLAFDKYLSDAANFAKEAAEAGIYTVFRLWNLDSASGEGKNHSNSYIEKVLKGCFPEDWQSRPRGYRLSKNIFLEYDGLFTWPSESQAEANGVGFCHGLSQQIGILADGTVVPCCLDSEGNIPLGNIFESDIEEILSSERALAISRGFMAGRLLEPLCQSCTYAKRFKTRNN